MYAGAAYAAAPYAGGATASTAAADLDAAATRLRLGGGVYVEQDFTAPLPETNAHSYVVALVYPTPTLVDGRPT